jgi:hypothetical protein
MRQGFAVTALLLVVGLPTAFFVDGGLPGVTRDFGQAIAFRPFASPEPLARGALANRSGGVPTALAAARNAVVSGTVSAVVSLATNETGTGSTSANRSGLDVYLGAPSQSYHLLDSPGRNVDPTAITGGIADDVQAADDAASTAAAQVVAAVTPQNYGAALQRFALAAAPGNADIRYAIGRDYLDATPADYADAAHWLLSAAELGSAKAALDLSGLYVDGNGVDRNYPQAYLWASVASQTLTVADDVRAALDRIDRVSRAMTDAERAAAHEMVRTWQPQSVPMAADPTATAASLSSPSSPNGRS